MITAQQDRVLRRDVSGENGDRDLPCHRGIAPDRMVRHPLTVLAGDHDGPGTPDLGPNDFQLLLRFISDLEAHFPPNAFRHGDLALVDFPPALSLLQQRLAARLDGFQDQPCPQPVERGSPGSRRFVCGDRRRGARPLAFALKAPDLDIASHVAGGQECAVGRDGQGPHTTPEHARLVRRGQNPQEPTAGDVPDRDRSVFQDAGSRSEARRQARHAEGELAERRVHRPPILLRPVPGAVYAGLTHQDVRHLHPRRLVGPEVPHMDRLPAGRDTQRAAVAAEEQITPLVPNAVGRGLSFSGFRVPHVAASVAAERGHELSVGREGNRRHALALGPQGPQPACRLDLPEFNGPVRCTRSQSGRVR